MARAGKDENPEIATTTTTTTLLLTTQHDER
jgi:hypothetical protein